MSTTQQPQQFPQHPQYPPPPYPPPAYPPPQQAGPPSTDTKKATWALVLAFIPGGIPWIISLVLAIQTLTGIRRGERVGGKKRAIAAFVVMGCWVLLFVAAFALADTADRDSNGEITSSGTMSVVDVEEGDCINVDVSSSTDVVRSVEATPCGTPHEWEAYTTFPLPDGDYPGEAAVGRAGDAGCLDAVRDFLGTTPQKAGLTVVPLFPVEESWGAGDHSVTCLVGYGDERRAVGTLADVGPRTGSGDDAVTT